MALLPQRKIVGVGISGAITTLLISVAKHVFSYEMTGEEAAAVLTLVTFLTGYFVSDAPQDPPKPM